MKKLTLILLGLFPVIVFSQKFQFGINAGTNMGWIDEGGSYELDVTRNTIPALNIGVFVDMITEDYLFRSGLSLEGSVYGQDEYRLTDINGNAVGLLENYEISSYLGLPLIVYPKKLPIGLHAGLKPKFEVGSSIYFPDPIDFGIPDEDPKNYEPINYLAAVQCDLVIGISHQVGWARFNLRYERGIFNRLANSPEFKEYDNEFKFLVNCRLWRSDDQEN